MATPNSWWEVYFLPASFFLRQGKNKKSQGTRSGDYGGCSKTYTSSSFRNNATRPLL